MLLMPGRVKFRKLQRGRRTGIATKGNKVCFGQYGIKALGNSRIQNNHIEACRLVMTRAIRGEGKMWIRVFPNKSFTKKPAETRMGKGKGDLAGWFATVKRGMILFELSGVPETYARKIFRVVAHKLPFKVKFVKRGVA